MDYKKVIKSRSIRVAIMRFLSFVPDRWMVSLQYRIKTGRKLNLKDPKRYTEKLQWYKLFYRDPLMSKCADKYEVREYVRECGYEDLLNPLLGVYENPDEIDFDALPNQFVIKDTLGGGGSTVLICRDKEELDIDATVKNLHQWVKSTYGKHPGREWVYDGRKNRIIIEKYLDSDPGSGGLIDYKFFCFQGKASFLYVVADRDLGRVAGLGIFTRDFVPLPYQRADEQPLTRDIERPRNYEEMLRIAEALSKPFPHARIDLYCQNGKIIFGEITFFDGSGYMNFKPDEFDFELGDVFVLPKN